MSLSLCFKKRHIPFFILFADSFIANGHWPSYTVNKVNLMLLFQYVNSFKVMQAKQSNILSSTNDNCLGMQGPAQASPPWANCVTSGHCML